MQDVLLSIDVGSASLRTALVSPAGKILKRDTRPIKLWQSLNRMELSSENIWQQLKESIANLLEEQPEYKVKGIGVDATASMVLLDENLEPLCFPDNPEANILGWMDHRSISQCEWINTHIPPDQQGFSKKQIPEMTLSKLLWLKEEHPQLWEQCGCILDLYDFITWKLTDQITRSPFSLTLKSLEAIKQLQLESANCFRGEVFPAGAPIPGGLSKAIANELGITAGTPVAVGIVDGYGGTLSVVAATNDDKDGFPDITRRLSMIAGTSTIYIASSHQPKTITNAWGPVSSALPDMHHNVTGQSAAGALIDFIVQQHPARAELEQLASSHQKNIFQQLNQILETLAGDSASIPTLTRESHMLPYFAGNRCPRMDMNLTGMLTGLKLDSSLENLALLYLTTIQSIALGARHNLDTLTEQGYDFELLMAAGGLAKNPLFMQEHVNAMGLPAALPEESDAMSLSGALIASLAAGIYTDVRMAMSSMTAYKTIINPDPSLAEYYDRKYDVFLELYNDQMKYKKIMERYERKMGWTMGLEPTTAGITIRSSTN